MSTVGASEGAAPGGVGRRHAHVLQVLHAVQVRGLPCAAAGHSRSHRRGLSDPSATRVLCVPGVTRKALPRPGPLTEQTRGKTKNKAREMAAATMSYSAPRPEDYNKAEYPDAF